MMKIICEICKREVEKLFVHHVKPKSRGGAKGEIIKCCQTCANQVHSLFSLKELELMTIQQLLETEEIKKYINWISKKKSTYFKSKISKRVKNK